MGGLTAWSVHKSFFFVNVSVVTEPAKDINIPKNLLFFCKTKCYLKRIQNIAKQTWKAQSVSVRVGGRKDEEELF